MQVWGDVLAAVLKRIVGRKSAQDALSQTLGHFDCKHRIFFRDFCMFLLCFFFKSLSIFQCVNPRHQNVHTFCMARDCLPPTCDLRGPWRGSSHIEHPATAIRRWQEDGHRTTFLAMDVARFAHDSFLSIPLGGKLRGVTSHLQLH